MKCDFHRVYDERKEDMGVEREQPITSLKGVGEKTAALFEKLGVYTVEDLLHYYPRAYDVYTKPVKPQDVTESNMVAVEAVITREADLLRFGKMQTVSLSLKWSGGALQIIWYNIPYIRTSLKLGGHYIFRGRVVKKKNRLVMEQPEMFEPSAYYDRMNVMQPIYGQTKGLGNRMISKTVQMALKEHELELDYIPLSIRKKNQLAEYNFALEHIHIPANQEELLFARKRLVFDEFFLFLIAVRMMQEKRANKESPYQIPSSREAECLIQSLPYVLTKAQIRTLEEIRKDMAGKLVMNRLIQGDVGSGKTIIAVIALLDTACAGYQGALMAPTEVLARQHYESIKKLFSAAGISKVPVLITGSMTAKEKKIAYEKIASHEADIIIGTHALIQEKVKYDKLALVITDEQHRFGVGQRESLGEKGNTPHVLVMSATPIPRTLAIILYGDLDISVMDELPQGRQEIKNCVVGTGYRARAYRFLEQEVAAGHQAYVICPMVESSELMDAENVLDYTQTLRHALPNTIRVEYLHGKMKGKEKNRIMEQFASGQIQILVSTTVIEVGVNVPNATVIMIENAERFGLAQLHQLRGRVGRGSSQSYCILVNTSESEESNKRLEILNHSNDGFYIASEDLKLRGPGDLFGIRQSGEMEFALADIFIDASLLQDASREVKELLEQDPDFCMEEHQYLKKYLDSYLKKSYDKINL